MKHKVYFYKVNDENLKEVPEIAKQLLKKVILDNKIKLENEIPLKVHPGNPGNVTFIKPKNFDPIIKYLQDKKITTYYIETNQAPVGARSKGSIHVQIAKNHGFTQIPFVIADGEDGYDHTLVKIKDGKHFKDCKIAKKLVNQRQIIVLSHFKGHVASGFGGAIKMLSLGFASGRGKIELHSKVKLKKGEEIKWMKFWTLYQGREFRERTAEYALAASQNKQFIYLNYAINLTDNCDCDGHKMNPIYKDLGIFASLDPVSIDKACFDILAKRERKNPYGGEDIFDYAQKIGLGNQDYDLIHV